MGFLDTVDTCYSSMSAQRYRMDIIANNIANSETTRTPDGGPYKRKMVVFKPVQQHPFSTLFSEKVSGGVEVAEVVNDESPSKMIYDPNHPDANGNGYVAYPNINMVTEMVDMISASRAYEASMNMFNMCKTMAMKAIDIGR